MFESKVECSISGGINVRLKPALIARYFATTIGATTSELLIERSFIGGGD